MQQEEQFDGHSLFDDIEQPSSTTTESTQPQETEIVIESFSQAYVRENDKTLFNGNNHHDYELDESNPTVLRKLSTKKKFIDDYNEVLQRCGTSLWIDEFQPHYIVLNVARHNLNWMKGASVIACQRSGISNTYKEDIEDTVRTTDTGDIFLKCDPQVPTSGYFVRTEKVSLKDGVHGAGPYFSLKQMLESSVTARMGHQGVDGLSKSLKFYLLPWKPELHPHREFRVFVCNGRVTAISQQSLYNANTILSRYSGSGEEATQQSKEHVVIRNWCSRLLPYIKKTVIPRLEPKSFVMDIALLGPPPSSVCPRCGSTEIDYCHPEILQPYFIEINPFGFAYSSGSSLFSWIDHHAILCGLLQENVNKVYFRHTTL